jgi:hypothetical protein
MEQMSRKRKIRSPLILDIGDITFVINRSIRQCIFNYESNIIADSGPCQKKSLAEFSLIEIFPNDDEAALSFLLFLTSNIIFTNIVGKYGISINGRCRGQATRIMINLGLWRPFTVKDIDNAYAVFLEGRAKKVLNIRREEVERKLEVKELEVNVLKRLLGQKGNKDGLLAHIIGIYARLSDTNEIITGMESDQREMSATIDSLKIAIRREQQKTATAKRSITAQKGMITKRLNALDLETSNRDTEWISLTSKLSKERGYNKMIATKNSNTLERKMNIMKENNIEITKSKISLPLLIFDCLKESVALLNIHKSW